MTADTTHEERLAANEDAAAFYRRQLLSPDGEGPRHYLTDRGFAALLQETPWAVGYAPASWTALHDHLAELGYADDTMLTAGLVSRSRRGNLVDRFRDRITFGIRDAQGGLSGFTARRCPSCAESCPKYLNTPTTPIYSKSEQLFGLGEYASWTEKPTAIVITEGPLDALAVTLSDATQAQASLGLAVCGTALTRAQAHAVTDQFDGTLLLAFDSDEAGRQAAFRAYAVLARHVRDVRVARHPQDEDPADTYRRTGSAGMHMFVTNSLPAINAIVDDCVDAWPAKGRGAEADLCCLRHVAKVITSVECLDAAAAARRLLQRLPLDPQTVNRELIDAVARRPGLGTGAASPSTRHTSRLIPDTSDRGAARTRKP